MASGIALRTTGETIRASSASGEGELRATLWLLCRTSSHHFALPIRDVIETLRVLPIEQIAGAPPLVRGLSIIRGAPVVILDTGLLFGDSGVRYERIVTARVGKRTIGFGAEAIIGVRAIPEQSIEGLPALLGNVEAIQAITTLDDELVFFLRAARAISDDFFANLSDHGLRA